MAYYIDLFTPETYEVFKRSAQNISGVRLRQRAIAERIVPGDRLVCYVTRLSRWCGILEVLERYRIDDTPIFAPKDDPFVVRFPVRPLVWLELEQSIPIHDPELWANLSFTRDLPEGSLVWTGKVRSSLGGLNEKDGKFLADRIMQQGKRLRPYPLSESDLRKVATHTVNRPDKVVAVSVPEDGEDVVESRTQEVESRESTRMQGLLASIGARMGLSIWIPTADRAAVFRVWKEGPQNLLERLPLNYDETTLKTISQIDVIWLKSRSIVRAFEVEHTTSVYSGILRMADLLALQPNMDIKLHIVAPVTRREKVFSEIRRPVFSLLEKGPLSDSCTYLSYESIHELASQKHLAHLSDSVLDEYAEDE